MHILGTLTKTGIEAVSSISVFYGKIKKLIELLVNQLNRLTDHGGNLKLLISLTN